MRLGGVLDRRAVADVAVHDDEAGPAGLRDGGGDRLIELAQRIDVAHLGDVPAVGVEALADVLGELDVGGAFKRDVIAVEEHDELAEAQMQAAGERCGLAGDPLHDVAFAAEREGAVVDDVETGPVEPRRQHPLGDRHPDRVRETLTERPGGHLDPWRHAPLGMTWRARAPLAELRDVVNRQVVATQMQTGVKEHRRVAAREHEAVAIRPVWMRRIVAQVPGEQAIRQRSKPHRRAGMSRFRALDRIDCEKADGVDRIAFEAGGRGPVGRPLHDHQIVARAVRFGRHWTILPRRHPISATACGAWRPRVSLPATVSRAGLPSLVRCSIRTI